MKLIVTLAIAALCFVGAQQVYANVGSETQAPLVQSYSPYSGWTAPEIKHFDDICAITIIMAAGIAVGWAK